MKRILCAALFPVLMHAIPTLAGEPTATASPSGDEIRAMVLAQMPPAPDGFAWNMFRNAVFLEPKGWFSHDLQRPAQGSVFATHALSPKDFSLQQPFETGFTVQVFSNLMKYGKPSPSKSAEMMLGIIAKGHAKEDIRYFSQADKGDFKVSWLEYRDAPPGLKPIIVRQFYLANDTTDNLDVFVFESPESRWDQDWKSYGEVMFKRLSAIPAYPND